LKIDYLEEKASVDDNISVLNTKRNELDYFDNQVFGHACESGGFQRACLNTGRQRIRANPPVANHA